MRTTTIHLARHHYEMTEAEYDAWCDYAEQWFGRWPGLQTTPAPDASVNYVTDASEDEARRLLDATYGALLDWQSTVAA